MSGAKIACRWCGKSIRKWTAKEDIDWRGRKYHRTCFKKKSECGGMSEAKTEQRPKGSLEKMEEAYDYGLDDDDFEEMRQGVMNYDIESDTEEQMKAIEGYRRTFQNRR
jgi:hypothetical protein